MHKAWLWLLPELQRLPAKDQDLALQKARDTDLDVVELLGVAFSLVLVTAATQYALPEGSALPRVQATLFNFLVALPLVGAAVAPFHLRRLRRGLRMQLELRSQHE